MEIYALFFKGEYSCALIQGQHFDTYNDEKFKEEAAKLEKMFSHDTDWTEISEEDFAKYLQGNSGGENGTGYIRDAATGKAVSAPARVYSYAEKISNVMNEFNSQASILKGELITAQIAGDEADIQRCKEDYSALVESSTATLYEVINE